MKILTIVASISVVLILILSLSFGAEHLGLAWNGYFKPKHESVERDVFKQTRSYTEGKIQDLAKLRLQYLQADNQEDKDAIRVTIIHMFAEVDKSIFSTELAMFLTQMRGY